MVSFKILITDSLIPACSMLVASYLVFFQRIWKTTVSTMGADDTSAATDKPKTGVNFEVLVQALSGGLILGVVATEIFPIIAESDFIGISLGFFGGLSFICATVATVNFTDFSCYNSLLCHWAKVNDADAEEMDPETEAFESESESKTPTTPGDREDKGSRTEVTEEKELIWDIDTATLGRNAMRICENFEAQHKIRSKLYSIFHLVHSMHDKAHLLTETTAAAATVLSVAKDCDFDGYGDGDIESSSSSSSERGVLMSASSSSSSIFLHSGQLLPPILETQMTPLMSTHHPSQYGSTISNSTMDRDSGGSSTARITITEAEKIADSLDSDIHRLQYLIDHCRRVLEGPATAADTSPGGAGIGMVPPSSLISLQQSKELERDIQTLCKSAKNSLALFDSGCGTPTSISSSKKWKASQSEQSMRLQGIYTNLKRMHSTLDRMHDSVDHAAFRFKRRRAQNLGPMPLRGSTIPIALLIPVCLDALNDGFLIGLSTALSTRAGFILSLVTMVEMAVLGAAYSIRVRKCDGSPISYRIVAITLPPLLIPVACLMGYPMANWARVSSFWLSVCVGFSAITLVQLATAALLFESFQAASGPNNGSIRVYTAYVLGLWLNLALGRIEDLLSIRVI